MKQEEHCIGGVSYTHGTEVYVRDVYTVYGPKLWVGAVGKVVGTFFAARGTEFLVDFGTATMAMPPICLAPVKLRKVVNVEATVEDVTMNQAEVK